MSSGVILCRLYAASAAAVETPRDPPRHVGARAGLAVKGGAAAGAGGRRSRHHRLSARSIQGVEGLESIDGAVAEAVEAVAPQGNGVSAGRQRRENRGCNGRDGRPFECMDGGRAVESLVRRPGRPGPRFVVPAP
jgi:hypothetical protein